MNVSVVVNFEELTLIVDSCIYYIHKSTIKVSSSIPLNSTLKMNISVVVNFEELTSIVDSCIIYILYISCIYYIHNSTIKVSSSILNSILKIIYFLKINISVVVLSCCFNLKVYSSSSKNH